MICDRLDFKHFWLRIISFWFSKWVMYLRRIKGWFISHFYIINYKWKQKKSIGTNFFHKKNWTKANNLHHNKLILSVTHKTGLLERYQLILLQLGLLNKNYFLVYHPSPKFYILSKHLELRLAGKLKTYQIKWLCIFFHHKDFFHKV